MTVAEKQVWTPALVATLPHYPLTPMQAAMAAASTLHPDAGLYLQQMIFDLHGEIRSDLLCMAWHDLSQSHEILRASLLLDESTLRIEANVEPQWQQLDYTAYSDAEQEALFAEWLQQDRRKGFDLQTAPLIRLCLFSLAQTRHRAVISYHHVILDGLSRRKVTRQLLDTYEAALSGADRGIIGSHRQPYALFGHWLTQRRNSGEESFWRSQTAIAHAAAGLPADTQTTAPTGVTNLQHRICSHTFSAIQTQAIVSAAQASNVEIPVLLLAAWAILLGRYCCDTQVVFGLTRTGRGEPSFDCSEVVGSLINTLPMAVDVSASLSPAELLNNIRGFVRQSRNYEHSPASQIKQWLGIETQKPLFETVIIINREEMAERDNSYWRIDNHRLIEESDLPVFLRIFTQPTLQISLHCARERYSHDYTLGILRHFCNLITQLAHSNVAQLSQLHMLDVDEWQRIVHDWNATGIDYPRQQTLVSLFEQQAAQTPQRIAALFGQQQCSYDELNRRANQLAHYLLKQGVGPETFVGLCMDRSLDMLTGLLGILKTGAAYVPLDPAYPPLRLAFMLEDSGARRVVCQRDVWNRIFTQSAMAIDDSIQLICLNTERDHIASESNVNPGIAVMPDQPAYVIYTSGSTGKPKGVVGLHRGAVNRFYWMWRTYPFDAAEVCCVKTRLSFVDAVWEIFGPLLRGVRLVLIDDEIVGDPELLITTLAAHDISRIVLVPSLLQSLLDDVEDLSQRLPHLKLWVCSGERLSDTLSERFRRQLPDRTLLNLYGSTEVSADATAYAIHSEQTTTHVTIGRPIANLCTYVLDPQLNPLPVGVPGELYIGGEGLARGYHNRPELTAAVFISNPFSPQPQARLFKTNDAVRLLGNGEIEYLGRLDHQVKLRGMRIELTEIEAALCEVEGIASAVVMLCSHPDGQNTDYLAAFCQIRDDGDAPPEEAELRVHLQRRLPAYMIPATYTLLQTLPLTPNGKVDRNALRQLPNSRPAPVTETAREPSELEQRLRELWENSFGIHPIGLSDNFFDLGGHSLLAIKLIAEIDRVFAKRLPIAALYKAPTIELLAEVLRQETGAGTRFLLAPVAAKHNSTPLFCIYGLFLYRHLANELGSNQPTYGIYIEEEANLLTLTTDGQQEDAGAASLSVEEIAARYIEQIRTIQPDGPYQLVGESFGGLIALEIARQLKTRGETVAWVGLLDTNTPQALRRSRIEQLRYHTRMMVRDGLSHVAGVLKRRWYRKNKADFSDVPGFEEESERRNQLRRAAMACYQWPVCDVPIVLFRARENSWPGMIRSPDLGWTPYARGGLVVHEVPGDHLSILESPNVATLAAKLEQHLVRLT
jgi:amino acid adenylation domain-containing protein